VTLLPPASDALLGTWRTWLPNGGKPLVMVPPVENAPTAAPRPLPVETAPALATPAETPFIAQRSPEPVEAPPALVDSAVRTVVAQPRPEPGSIQENATLVEKPSVLQLRSPVASPPPAGNAAIAAPRPEPQKIQEDAILVEKPSMLEQRPPVASLPPAGNAVIAVPRPEPQKIQEDATFVEKPSVLERRPPVASLPPAGNAAIAARRPEPAKTQKNAALVAIPSLPGRSPFRPAPFKSEIVESGPTAAVFQQQVPEPRKGNAASRFLANLWPGNKEASTPVSSTAEGRPPAVGGNAGTLGPSASAQGQAETAQKSDKPPIKRFLDGIQFWKN
jgi:hypothetical protein